MAARDGVGNHKTIQKLMPQSTTAMKSAHSISRRVAQHRADDKGVEIEKIGGATGDLRWRWLAINGYGTISTAVNREICTSRIAPMVSRAARPGSSDRLTGEAYTGEDKNNLQVIDGPAQWYRCQQVEGDD